jgi:hypothetical protein
MKIIEQTDIMGNTYEVVVIENEDGSYTSMAKAYYDTEFPSKPKKTITQSE